MSPLTALGERDVAETEKILTRLLRGRVLIGEGYCFLDADVKPATNSVIKEYLVGWLPATLSEIDVAGMLGPQARRTDLLPGDRVRVARGKFAGMPGEVTALLGSPVPTGVTVRAGISSRTLDMDFPPGHLEKDT